MKIHEIITKVHELTKRKWKIQGEYKVPDEDRVILMLVNLELLLNNQPGDLAQVESGGIILRRDGNHIDTYVHVGELDLDSDSKT